MSVSDTATLAERLREALGALALTDYRRLPEALSALDALVAALAGADSDRATLREPTP